MNMVLDMLLAFRLVQKMSYIKWQMYPLNATYVAINFMIDLFNVYFSFTCIILILSVNLFYQQNKANSANI